MIWYVCAVAAVILMVLSMKSALNKHRGAERIGIALAALSGATFVIYIPVFFKMYNAVTAIFCDVINIFQVISLDADYTAYYDMIISQFNATLMAKLYMVLLGIIHFLMPTVSLLAIYNILMLCYSGMEMFFVNRHRRPLYVFSEKNEHSLNLAKDIKNRVGKCDIVFANCNDGEHKKNPVQEYRFVFHPSELEKIPLKANSKKNIYYFCISDNEDGNLNTALYLIDVLSKLSDEIKVNSHIYIFSEQQNVDVMIDSTQKSIIDIKIVNRSESSVYKLITEYPLYRYAPKKQISILLCGFGKINVEMLKAILWCGVIYGYSLKINVAGIDISNAENNFYNKCPDLKEEHFGIHFIDCENTAMLEKRIAEQCKNANYIVVDADDDQKAINEALMLRRLFYNVNNKFDNAPPIFLYLENPEKSGMIEMLRTSETNQSKCVNYNLIPFGVIDKADTYNNLISSDLDYLSKNVHMEYEDIFGDGNINVQESLKRYNLLEVNKRSNRANAMHIKYKLALLGLDYTDDENAEEVDLQEFLSTEKLELLTRSEHVRWMSFLQTEGWTTASVSEVKAYIKSGISAGKHNCQLLKKHPYICDFDELAKRSEFLGLPDSTVYDRELILRIPNILHDKWNVSGKKYKIIKLKNMEE